ncbi:hypothetical protein CK510_11830 [Brunnivagina elsteri CCALA 953]|uniref:Uncharacterized protein n=2 Tax=Brunnivagina TaxID=3344733 RepID=A0A2A2TJ30_9CYAN|nr:hypothetical protein CK510_11830 [Calothrix elsteri CCALA 953]
MPYSKARGILINSGWQAVFNLEQINNPDKSAPVSYFINKGYTEIVDCAGSGLGLCLFQFRNAYGKILNVTTANNGESQEIVFGWKIEEPEKTSATVNTGCAPRDNKSRILSSPKPNDIHPNWRGDSYIGASWSFITKEIITNDTGKYLKGDLYSPRGGLINENIFVIENEWDCNVNESF